MELDTGRWIVARTKPRREDYARQNVLRQGYEAYLPKCVDHAGRVSVLFPNYLFCYTPGSWHWLRSTYGISDLVWGCDGAPAMLPEAEINKIKAREQTDGLIDMGGRLQPGQRVRVTGGSLMHSVGLFERYDGADRVRLLLDFLGGKCALVVEERFVAAA